MAEEPMDRKLVAQLGRAAAHNAIQLAGEADLLDQNGHTARAFALTTFAAEELGKALICMMTERHAREPKDWAAFDAMVRGHRKHETKLLGALFLLQQVHEIAGMPIDQLAHELSDLTAGDLDDAKMRALYVDIEGGAVATPAIVADDEGAQQKARSLRKHVIGWALALGVRFGEDDSASSP